MRTRLPAAVLLLGAVCAHADLSIQMTMIGNPGNSADWTGFGAVDHAYQIGTYEVTVGQYTEFLNATAASDPYGLYNETMATGPLGAFITRSGTDGSYTYSAVSGTENQAVRNVSFYDGIRLANWLANGQGNGDTETGSYTLADGIWLSRNSNATWVVPSEDEWYKAAYFDASNALYHTYPNGSDAVPAEPTDETTSREMNFGGPPFWQGTQYYTSVGQTTGHTTYGVYDMGGNVQEWSDTLALPSANRITSGGQLMDHASDLSTTGLDPADPTTDGDLQGLRLAHIIPEPSTVFLCFTGLAVLLVSYVKSRFL